MPLLEGVSHPPSVACGPSQLRRRESEQYSTLARAAMLSVASAASSAKSSSASKKPNTSASEIHVSQHDSLMPPARSANGRAAEGPTAQKPLPTNLNGTPALGQSLSDTPAPSTPGSPSIAARQKDLSANTSGTGTPRSPRLRATTLNIPGLTRSRVSPDGRIAERDVGSKLIIIMVGLPARGKSYIVKKIARYLNWLQHPTRIFNVGDRRRVAAGTGQTLTTIEGRLRESVRRMSRSTGAIHGIADHETLLGLPAVPAHIMINDQPRTPSPVTSPGVDEPQTAATEEAIQLPPPAEIEQSSSFFDPENKEAKLIREQVAHETLDELLKYVLVDGGSVGILDATNHTIERRMSLIRHIKERDSTVNIMFLESRCQDRNLLQANMRLKLSGPDYKDKDPVKALQDFQQRVEQYEKKYESLGDFEENHNLSYCSMIDVGRKMVSHKCSGFLSIQTVTYLMNFNLAPRQIWLTRHGESMDNVDGKIGGDSHLSSRGENFSKTLEQFITYERTKWTNLQIQKQATTHFPPLPGDTTPPNPEHSDLSGEVRNFCVWTSMLKRSIESAAYFPEEDYDVKQMRMLDELNAGYMEGMTYQQIKENFKAEYELRKRDKLHYRYPGPGGEGYLDVINRLRKVILEIERMTDHVLIIGHRSITRVLLAYFLGLKQEDISDLDVPLGVVYMLEPRPYGVEFKAYRWHPNTSEFVWEEDYRLKREIDPQA